MISFSFCTKKNKSALKKFLKKNWRNNYVMGKNNKLLDWQFYLNHNNKYNIIIATHNTKIIGCLGLITHSKFSKKLISNDTVWLANWITIKKFRSYSLGFLNFLIKNKKYKKIGTVGCNFKTASILKIIGFKSGKMNHHFTINPIIKNFKILNVPKKFTKIKMQNRKDKDNALKTENNKFKLKILNKNTKNLELKFGKDETYFINRYILHPYYKYKIYWIYSFKNKALGFIVTRICKHKNKKALRIVDFFGYDKALYNINKPLQKLLIKLNAEYVDFYHYGLKKSVMRKSGLYKNKFNTKTVVPNYFEPFVKKNVDLKWAFKSVSKIEVPIFKGDCDQDRPSIL